MTIDNKYNSRYIENDYINFYDILNKEYNKNFKVLIFNFL